MSQKKVNGGLTGQQLAFVQYYAKIGIAKKAAELAGYSPKSSETQAVALMKNPKVLAALDKIKKRVAKNLEKKLLINQETLLKDAEYIKNRTMYGEPVYDADGDLTDIVGQDERVAVQAIALQAKLLGIEGFGATKVNQNVQINHNTSVSNSQYDLTKLNPTERQALAVLLHKARIEPQPEEIKEAEKPKAIEAQVVEKGKDHVDSD